ncbi:MAG TPA: 3-oxoacyl-[acyl-carrier-protein] synthase III C-terminal domain-containing protein [Micromonosporaceae bacterium]|nr:3-oxoacyl-[acyl-carrier-protein] synthase III C-terminal domain-containing protein [Micromonosporaceae bacterium]
MPYIAATATSLPRHYYDQQTLATTLRRYCQIIGLDIDLDIIDSLFRNSQIDGRYFAIPLDTFFDPPPFSVVAARCVDEAADLCEETVRKLLDQAGIKSTEISQLTSMMSTVVSVPTVDAILINRFEFSPRMKRMPINGLGCMSGVAGLSRVADYLKGHPEDSVILLTCELGGSAFWQGGVQGYLQEALNRDLTESAFYTDLVSQIVTVALFGDGVAAALLVGDEHPLVRPGLPRVVETRSGFLPDTLQVAGVDVLDSGFRNRLSVDVPGLAKVGLRPVLDPLLADYDLTVEQVGHWMIHPGGPKVLLATAEEFGMDDEDLKLSQDVLRRIGNVSGPTVLYMLDETFRSYELARGTYGLVVGMGPGFSQEAVLLQW